MPTESALLGIIKLVQRDDLPSDLEQHRKEHAQAALIARATFVLLHVFSLATLFTCGSDLQQSLQGGHRLYLGGFLALLLANSALYVALNLSDPGYLEPGRHRYGVTDVEEGKEVLPLTDVATKGAQNSRQGRRISQRPFDLGRLLAAEMGADDQDDSQAGSQSQSDVQDAVSLSGSTDQSPSEQHTGSLRSAEQRAPLDAASGGLISAQTQLAARGASLAGREISRGLGSFREAGAEAGLEPDSWRSSLQAPDQAELSSGRLSEGGAPMGGGDLGGWADVLPAGGSLLRQGTISGHEPDLAPEGTALAARRSDLESRSTEGSGSQQSLVGYSQLGKAASDDFLIGAVHHGCRGLSEESRSSSRTVAWFERALPGRLCEWCGAWQRLRAHHCALCDRCVDTYDHHCAWIGTCVGARNRPMFVGFLASQSAVLAWSLQAAVSCLHNAAPLMPDSAFFGYDWEVVASIGMLVFLLTFVACLLGYQLFLAATAQTTREHSCSGQVAYLTHVPAHVHPFSRGVVGNLWDFAFENADREWGLPSIEEMVMREHARSEEHCC